jgi:hypothetical protein
MPKGIHVSMFGAYETPKAHFLRWPRMFKHFSQMVKKTQSPWIVGHIRIFKNFFLIFKIQHTQRQ